VTVDLSFIKKTTPRTFQEVEKNLWKNNIGFTARNRIDYLDISREDFTKTSVDSIDGRQSNPSSFNIFRDSLK
jgi:hypothetical protein